MRNLPHVRCCHLLTAATPVDAATQNDLIIFFFIYIYIYILRTMLIGVIHSDWLPWVCD